MRAKRKNVVFVAQVPDEFIPEFVGDFPGVILSAHIEHTGKSYCQAADFVRRFNAERLAHGHPVQRWAILSRWIRPAAKEAALQQDQDNSTEARRDLTVNDVCRLLAACDNATEPANLPGITAAEWWRSLFIELITTGRRASKIRQRDPAWLCDTKTFYQAGREIFRDAGIEDNLLFHAIRRFHFLSNLEPNLETKGGAA